jgi:hypothetical protein
LQVARCTEDEDGRASISHVKHESFLSQTGNGAKAAVPDTPVHPIFLLRNPNSTRIPAENYRDAAATFDGE